MPELSRPDAPLTNPEYPQGTDRATSSSEGRNYNQQHSTASGLRSSDVGGESRVNRSAKTVGRTVGSAVSGARQFPRRVDEARWRFYQASRTTRANASAVLLEMMDSAAHRADDLRRTTGATISGWAHAARDKASQVGDQAAGTWQELRATAKERLAYAGRRAIQAQRSVTRLQQEDPARFLAVVAGTAFVIGAGLRIWRSSND